MVEHLAEWLRCPRPIAGLCSNFLLLCALETAGADSSGRDPSTYVEDH